MTVETKRLSSKLVRNLSEAELAECERCSYGYSAGMMSEVRRARRSHNSKTTALMLRSPSGELVAWALMFKRGHAHGAMFYVPTKYRRQGLGRRLMQAVQRRDPKARVFPYNKTAQKFFANFPTMPSYDYWREHKLQLVP